MKTVTCQEFQRELEKAKALLQERTCVPNVHFVLGFVNMGTAEVSMGVNVVGVGRVTAAFARGFAHCVEVAADIAANFKYNGYTVV